MSEDLAARAVRQLRARGLTLASAESLTGGLVAATVTAVPGASAVYVGGVTAYAARTKVGLLGVPEEVVARDGVVSAACASAMAAGARRVLGCDVAVSTTGVAGPDSQEGKPVGLVYVAVAGPAGVSVEELRLTGGRDEIRAATVVRTLELLVGSLSDVPPRGVGAGG